MTQPTQQRTQISQSIMIGGVVTLVALIAAILLWSNKPTEQQKDIASTPETQAKDDHDEGQELALTSKQMAEQGVKLAVVAMGNVQQIESYPAKLMVNTDRQAHVSSSFSGRVEAVHVNLGQTVKKGQALATLRVPDLVDQQANLRIAEANLTLTQQDYQREQSLWSQGISAKQDYQRAYNAYQQAQVQVQAARSRLAAFGVGGNSHGQYVLTAPIGGVVSSKDIVIGENVQLASQLFVIDQLDQLWLEFVLPTDYLSRISPNQELEFKSLQTGNRFKVRVQTLNAQADEQTGRLLVRAQVLSQAAELRPNLMVNIELQQTQQSQVIRVLKSAVQQVEGQDSIFIAQPHGDKIEFMPQTVSLGALSTDGQWVEVKQGLKIGQSYVGEGSFLLKSELEKGEADHGH
ncbi:efflux RND transporter periplasmic adaptor subunit [Acinetobacter rudis]|uniref:efflux RND transporter periplasmic adaptor subunit n=1 Tax=Acinetobacter rudis TaxID=632955 RepID=UPI0028101C76|nr:efflux RND transporter periplasmic adaptor subunit [Acinetobacter rudis]MDQ8953077.1 efflux RND transporter periplasmic adaptor subunit [Acinetobacter rudis]